MRAQVIAVTGASGFVGSAVARRLSDAGYRVVALGRRPIHSCEHRHFDLTTPVPGDLLVGVDAVIHCAYDLSLTDSRAIAATNVQSTKSLAGLAAAGDVRMILVSSMSAYPGTTQVYGQAKLASEADVLGVGGEAVRLGLVWGGSAGGMIGTLKRLARLPVVPSFGRDLYQFTVYIDDAAAGILGLLESDRFGEPIGLAHPAPVRFESIVKELADGRPPRFVPIPWRPTLAALRVAERLGISLPVRADSLLGLVRPASHVPNVERWEGLGVQLSPFAPAAQE